MFFEKKHLRAKLASLSAELADANEQWRKAINERFDAWADRDRAVAERDQALAERNKLAADRDEAVSERNKVAAERDEAIIERKKLVADREVATAERDVAAAERDRIRVEREKTEAERNNALAERDRITAAEQNVRAALEQTKRQRDEAYSERDKALFEAAKTGADLRDIAGTNHVESSKPVRAVKLFDDGVLGAVARLAGRYEKSKVNGVISPQDGGMQAPTETDFAHYRRDGKSAMEFIFKAMIMTHKSSLHTILDLPCGYGRIARHLVAAFPEAKLTVCDIEADMINFCANHFGGMPILSKNKILEVQFSEQFDLIWCGSLLTHLPEEKFRDALRLFSRSLAPGGIAVVTTHGRYSPWFGRGNYLPGPRFVVAERSFYRRGFGYIDYSEEPGPSTGNYGITLSAPSYVVDALEEDLSIRIVSFTERGWNDHQDVVVFTKKPII